MGHEKTRGGGGMMGHHGSGCMTIGHQWSRGSPGVTKGHEGSRGSPGVTRGHQRSRIRVMLGIGGILMQVSKYLRGPNNGFPP
jgi:hypothetical protein